MLCQIIDSEFVVKFNSINELKVSKNRQYIYYYRVNAVNWKTRLATLQSSTTAEAKRRSGSQTEGPETTEIKRDQKPDRRYPNKDLRLCVYMSILQI